MDAFWDNFSTFLVQLQVHFNTNDVHLADRLATRGDDYIHIASVMRIRIHQSAYSTSDNSRFLLQNMASDLNIVLNEVQSLVQHFESISVENSHIEDMPMHVALDTITTGNPGRPAFVIPSSQIEDMLQIGLNFEQISTILGISTWTLRRHRQRLGMPVGMSTYSDISDDELDAMISSILNVKNNGSIDKMLIACTFY